MRIFCSLILSVTIAIVVKRCRAKFLLVEMDDAAGKGKPCFLIQIQYQSIATVRLKLFLNPFHIKYTLGSQVEVAMQRSMKGDPTKNITKATRPLTDRKLKGKKFCLNSYL